MMEAISVEAMLASIAIAISVISVLFSEWRARHTFRATWTRNVVTWAISAQRQLSIMEHDFETADGVPADQLPDRTQSLSRLAELSAIIDEGRLFFENSRKSEYGSDKPSAHQGLRPKLLDHLVYSYRSYQSYVKNEKHNPANTIRKRRKAFNSHVQELIDPKWFAKKASYDTSKLDVVS